MSEKSEETVLVSTLKFVLPRFIMAVMAVIVLYVIFYYINEWFSNSLAGKALKTLEEGVGRGVGTPLECNKETEELRAGLCYPKCPTDYQSDGSTLCYENPPAEWPGKKTITHLQHDTFYSTVGTTNTIPNACTDGTLYAGLCYKLPDTTWHVTAPGFIGKKCESVLPGFNRDDGTTCWRDAITKGRGAGYPWKFGDALNLDKARARCEKDHGANNCEKYGEIYYPKCQKLFGSEYSASGCCTCLRPAKTASKQVKSLIGTLPDKCPEDKQLFGRLCYPNCGSIAKSLGKKWEYERRADNLEFCSTKCPTGFKNIGVGGCERPNKSVGVGKAIYMCNDPLVKDGLLCYPKCEDVDDVKTNMTNNPDIIKYNGVGPVCWPEYKKE